MATLLITGGAPSIGRAAGSAGPAAASGATVNIALNADPPALDPAASSALVDRMVLNSICDKLVDLNSKGKIVPMLATSWKVTKNHLVYTLTLRKGVKFQDGTPFNAQAVKYNFDRNMAPSSIRAGELAFVQSVTPVGSYSVKISLKAPFSPLMSILTDRSGMMISPKAGAAEGANFRDHPVCTGPFMYQDRVKGDHITLVRNPHYWRKGYPKAAKVVYKIFTDVNTEYVNLESGQVDMTDTLPATEVASVAKSSKLALVNKASMGYQGIWLNVKSPPLNSQAVRQAISMLIDRKALVKVIFGNTAKPGNSPFAPGDLAYDKSDAVPAPDPTKAKQLLAKAHASNVSFTYLTTPDPIATRFAQFVQSELKNGGITMTIQTVDFGTLLNDTTKHNFQAAQLGWSGRPDPDQNIYDFFVTGGKNNSADYSNATVDSLLKQARTINSNAKRKADYDKIMSILHTQVPYVFLYHPNNLFGMSRSVTGFTYVPDGIIRAIGMSKK
ncbi:MAG: peptide ABC transporter substrate-binding protein [Chloroflexi bacterium]|nr:peptide ABC transporter substrate-binding protein [Chloroflexota bacterium]